MDNTRVSKMRKIFIFFICIYQATISPFLGSCCRFYPSCSHYSIQVLKKYPLMKGLALIVKRIIRCGPWSRGGHDPIP
ncbi:MAG: membrane protein insertion efficiency factor YidD [Chlamydiae bacterium]|nr:membrane protein insertion efficiency factor YidD [Chlamydiota bacterium]